MAVKNREASVLMRLKNQAKEEGISYQIGLQLFFQEEFLRRLSLSEYRDNMILKGGMFIYTLTEFDSRPTRDMDFMLRKMSNELSDIRTVMENVCAVPTENNYIKLEVTGTEHITMEKKYPGVKTKLIGRINNVRVPFSIDVGIDDVIVPEAEVRSLVTRLEGFSAPRIYTYSIESTIAEKLDAILQRMETTSRMKDFFDIYYLSSMFDFSGEVLQEAIKQTAEHREHTLEKEAFKRIANFSLNRFLIQQWSNFEPARDVGLAFEDALDRIHSFIEPVVMSIIEEKEFSLRWSSIDKEWK